MNSFILEVEIFLHILYCQKWLVSQCLISRHCRNRFDALLQYRKYPTSTTYTEHNLTFVSSFSN